MCWLNSRETWCVWSVKCSYQKLHCYLWSRCFQYSCNFYVTQPCDCALVLKVCIFLAAIDPICCTFTCCKMRLYQGWDNAWPLGETGPWDVFGLQLLVVVSPKMHQSIVTKWPSHSNFYNPPPTNLSFQKEEKTSLTLLNTKPSDVFGLKLLVVVSPKIHQSAS